MNQKTKCCEKRSLDANIFFKFRTCQLTLQSVSYLRQKQHFVFFCVKWHKMTFCFTLEVGYKDEQLRYKLRYRWVNKTSVFSFHFDFDFIFSLATSETEITVLYRKSFLKYNMKYNLQRLLYISNSNSWDCNICRISGNSFLK